MRNKMRFAMSNVEYGKKQLEYLKEHKGEVGGEGKEQH
jgi:hypothetical protein